MAEAVAATPPPPAARSAPSGAQAVQRALGLLHCFQDNGPELSASDLARRTGLSVSTAHRLARALVSMEFLEQNQLTARYRLGPAVAELGQLTFHQRGLHLAAPELEVLARRTGATADLAIRSGQHALILVGDSVRPDSGLGLRRPLHSTALGKVLLAWPDPGEPAPGLPSGHPLRAFTNRTIVDPALLATELERVRLVGHALNDGESADGVRTVAVPVLDSEGQARFALAVRSTPERLTAERLPEVLREAHGCATALCVLLLPPDQRPRPA
ncbi:IclR family transcriptional regulator [Kitasatospora kifunensis]|uniref:Glycerol operon regulatory protein n=1 Tax=Kitasatospora kifunensis TaxID=58351 RepID=A0A7W7R792_KITKI|nr:IclR family transcriptional regulator [Kitasatospora kifunensis]MBB4926600.1 DNA-binding IclR family transcriptional regulator [Kitasatospora kifunensis]